MSVNVSTAATPLESSAKAAGEVAGVHTRQPALPFRALITYGEGAGENWIRREHFGDFTKSVTFYFL